METALVRRLITATITSNEKIISLPWKTVLKIIDYTVAEARTDERVAHTLIDFLENNKDPLLSLFSWDNTTEGGLYWAKINRELRELSE